MPDAQGRFVAGDPRPPGAGRLPGQPNRKTSLINAGLRSAIETLRHGDGPDPVAASFKIAKVLEGMAAKRMEALLNAVGSMPGDEYDRIANSLKESAMIHLKLANFAFPKLRAHEYIGDAPTVAVTKVENRVQFVVAINAKQRAHLIEQINEPQDCSEKCGASTSDEHSASIEGNRAGAGAGAGNGHAHDDDGVCAAVDVPGTV